MDTESYWRLVRGETRGLGATLARAGLGVLSQGYRVGVATRNLGFNTGLLKAHHVDARVVSVGNLTVGGVGKTPFVDYLCQWFQQRKVGVGILSRGYGAEPGQPNDEALVLAQSLPTTPHYQGRDRVRLARKMIADHGVSVLVLDDGFQHRRLRRDLDLVLIDATNPLAGGKLLPAGGMREPLSSLRRADVVILTRADQASETEINDICKMLARWVGAKPIVPVAFAPSGLASWSTPGFGNIDSLSPLAGARILAFAGIGNPHAFFQSLNGLGANLVDQKTFPDHHRYNADDLQKLEAWVDRHQPQMVVTTLKDAVKLKIDTLGGVPLRLLKIDVKFLHGQDDLDHCLTNVLPAI